MYETFEHTADLGLRVRASDLDTLFAEAAQALFGAIVDDLGTVQPLQKVGISVAGTDREYLLFDWLSELLYRYETEHWVFSKFEVRVGPEGLTAAAWGEPLDAVRHAPGHEVKAITYHALKVDQTADGWLAEVIVDI